MRKAIFLFSSLLLLLSCSKKNIDYPIESFVNVLNIKNVPQKADDKNLGAFFDLGSWFGFALPLASDSLSFGTFPGPFSNISNIWISKGLIKTVPDFLFDDIPADSSVSSYLPGKLVHSVYYDSLVIEQQLIFISQNAAILKISTINNSETAIAFKLKHTGTLLIKEAEITTNDSKVSIWINTDNSIIDLEFQKPKFFLAGSDSLKSYEASDKTFRRIPAKTSESEYITITFANTGTIKDNAISIGFTEAESFFKSNENRWQNYINKAVYNGSIYSENPEYRRLAVKALLTLTNNWRAARGGLLHDGIIPSYSVDYFDGFWAWDSWKHAAAVSSFEPNLAKNQIRAMFHFISSKGMVPDCIFADSLENNLLNSKPPLAAWAVMEVYKNTGDTAFMLEMLPNLMRYHDWWYKYRDINRNGLCEYGANENNLEAAKWESGMDNAVRFDKTRMLQAEKDCWSMNQESVDLNSYLFAEKLALAEMLKILKKDTEADKYTHEAETLKNLINGTFYNEKKDFYFDVNFIKKDFVNVMSPEAWIPLFARAADKNKAKQVVKQLKDSAIFNTFVPIPTVAKNNPEFSTGYWRGTVWLDQAYFAIVGLRNYKYDSEADEFTRKIFDNAQGLINSDKPIYENYWPLDGKGMRTPNFSWSAAHLLLLYNEK